MTRPMIRCSILIGAVVFLGAFAQPSMSQLTMQFPVSRDVGLDSWDNHNGYGGVYDKTFETEEFTNHGGIAGGVRGKKFTQHSVLMDWDSDAINQWIADNTNAGDSLSWTFNVYPMESPIDDIQIVSLESLNDWVEGDGAADYENFNWSEDTGAVTQNFAVTYWVFDDDGDKVLDEDRSIPWVDDDTGTGGNDDNQYSVLTSSSNYSEGDPIPNFINSVDLSVADLDDAVVQFSYAGVELDDELIGAILNDANNRGIVFGPINDGSVNAGTNWRIWTREGSGNLDADGGPELGW